MEHFDLKRGLCGEAGTRVTGSNTAREFGSGKVEVFGTPAMVALMEKASIEAVDKFLPPGYATVGIALDIRHIAATPLECNVTASSELQVIDGRKLTFKVAAFDEKEKIGEGIHKRYIVELAGFEQKADIKKNR